MVELKKRLPDLVIAGLVILVLVVVSRLQVAIPIYPYQAINWQWILNLAGEDKIDANVKAAILPHDAASFRELAQFYRGLAKANPEVETIVVVSPNHYNTGAGNIQTTMRSFQTVDGNLDAEAELVNSLRASGVAEVNGDTFVKEHGVTVEVNYLKRFFPNANFLPIVLKETTTAREVDGLVLWLTSNLPANKSLVLGSIDFSHYLTKAQADKNDAKTLAQIKSMNLTNLPTMDAKCEYLDSPMGLRAVIQYARAVEGTKLTVVRHDDTTTIFNRPDITSTTSHFYITFALGGTVQIR